MTDLAEFLLARIAEDEADALDFRDSGEPGWWTYERMRAECDAKRRIVNGSAAMHGQDSDWDTGYDSGADAEQDRVLRALALPFADHPDWREEWRP